MQDKGYSIFFDKIFSMMIPDSSTKSIIQKFGILRRIQISAVKPSAYLVEKFNEYKPDFFYGNKTAMQLMASYALEHNIEMHKPKCIGSISEALDDNSRKTIEKAFGNALFDIYGAAELGNFAIEKSGKPWEHRIWHDTHVVNVIDDEGNIIDDGIGQIVVTPIKHFGFPMLNYVVGDYVETYTKDGVRYISKIIGRANDKIKNAVGSVYGWMHVNRLMAGIVEIAQYRFTQESYEELKLELVMEKISNKTRQEIEDLITLRSKEIFTGEPKNIVFEWKDILPPDPNGKLRILVSKI
jgi:phenylacetate-coenzyme A ligase PaaK-like adenylate-forming protein